MGEKIVVGPVNRGLKTDVTPFNIDNDSFPVIINAYQWRGRIKRKRGTSLLNRLQRFIGTTNGAGNAVINILPIPILEGLATFKIGTDIFMDPGGVSPVNLITNSSGTGVLDRTTGVLTITGSQINTAVIYYPTLPVMGLEELNLNATQFPGTIAFDTSYSYNISIANPYNVNDVSFYKNPSASASLPGYAPKATWTPTTWNGQDYQQFWTTNYQGALWATNGINVPFVTTNIGMQFAPASTITWNATNPTTINVTITNCPLVVGDFVFVNEWTSIVPGAAQTLNYQSGYVITCVPNTPALAAKTMDIVFPNANLSIVAYTPGIIQYLTNRSDTSKDSIRWYDGDPTDGNPTSPTFIQGKGWVNFAPPLNNFVLFPNFSIADLPPAQYYLVSARMIVPFKDRLLFLGPVIQTSAANSQVYLQDTIIYSQNGTPYYTCSFTGDPSLATTVFNPILVPVNQTATATAYWEDLTGFGGFITAGLSEPIITCSSNQDVLIVGFTNTQTRVVYSGNDIVPFNFYLIDSELGSGSTFSVINMGKGVITRGQRGYIVTSQNSAERIDLDIPDQVFEIRLIDNGNERMCSQRDFVNEWIFFTYSSNAEGSVNKFPNQTLKYNYRDQSWSINNESFTTYGTFRKQTGFTWATVGTIYPTWSSWNDPWNAGTSTLLQQEVIAGNQQGFVFIRNVGTAEATSLTIQNIVGNLITSPDHSLNNGDYIMIDGCNGTVSAQVNGKIFSVYAATQNTFRIDPSITSSTYLGGGLITRFYNPFIQTKQFPVAWDLGRKVRLGVQQYLLTTTEKSQITLLIYLSQNSDSAYNFGPIVPTVGSLNNSLVYSAVLFTCPESSNLGLTPANTNLQMISLINPSGTNASSPQAQIWHRLNTSLIGDSIQLGFTMSDTQMRAIEENGMPTNAISEIELHGFILDVNASQWLS